MEIDADEFTPVKPQRRRRHRDRRWHMVLITGWHRYPLGEVPRVPGLYAIYFRGCLVYVGKSTSSIAGRVETHIQRQPDGRFSCPGGFVGNPWEILVKYSPWRREPELGKAERDLIRRLNPAGNVQCRTGRAVVAWSSFWGPYAG